MPAKEFRVLVVEDDAVQAAMYGDMLKPFFVLEIADSAVKGLARARDKTKATIDAIMLDLNLPNGAGVELVTRFQRAVPDIPTIVVTAYEFPPEESILAGAQEYLPKPVDIRLLLDKLAHAIARHRVRKRFEPLEKQIEEMRELLDTPCNNKAPSSAKVM